MSLYETVFIARQDLTAEDVDALSLKLSNIITENSGKIVSKEYWGLRNLSYVIKKNTRGHYVLLNIDAEYNAIAELKRIMSYNEDIIRSIVFKVEKHEEESLLFVSKDAKESKNKQATKKDQTALDLILDQIQFDA